MKVLLDIKDDMAVHLLEVLKSLPYVKAEQLSEEKEQMAIPQWQKQEVKKRFDAYSSDPQQAMDADTVLDTLEGEF